MADLTPEALRALAGGWYEIDTNTAPVMRDAHNDAPIAVWLPDGTYRNGQIERSPAQAGGVGTAEEPARAVVIEEQRIAEPSGACLGRETDTSPERLSARSSAEPAQDEAGRIECKTCGSYDAGGFYVLHCKRDDCPHRLPPPPDPRGLSARLRADAKRIGLLFILALQTDDRDLRSAASLKREEITYRGSDGRPKFAPLLKAADALDALQREVERLEKLVYVPGVWKCAKCGCGVVSTNLHINSGGFSANNEPQQCPNNCGPMWRKAERQAGNELCDIADKQQVELNETRQRAEAAESELSRLRERAAKLRFLAGDDKEITHEMARDWNLLLSAVTGSPPGPPVPPRSK